MSKSKDLFRDIVKYLPSKIGPAVMGVIFLPIVTRLFSPEVYGNYVSVIVTITFLSTFAGWVNSSVLRFYPAFEKEGKGEEFTALSVKLMLLTVFVFSISFLCFLWLLGDHISRSLYILLYIGLFIFVINSFFVMLLDILRIQRKVNWYNVFFVWKNVTAYIFGLVLVVLFHFNIDGLLWGIIISIIIALPFLWKTAIGSAKMFNKVSLKPAVEMARYSFPLVIGNLAAWILRLSDRFMLHWFRDAYEVGIYSISYQISDQSILVFTSLFAIAFNPLSVIVWEKEGYKKSQEFLTKGTRYFLILCIPAIVGLSILCYPILRILSTSQYYAGAKIIPFIVLGVFFLELNGRFGAGLSFYKKTHFFMYGLLIAGLVNIVLNLVFIPQYGYMAAAITTLISYVLLTVLTILFSRRYFVWDFPFSSLIRVCSASVLMGIVLYFISGRFISLVLIDLLLSVCIGAILYFVLLFLFREFQPGELKALRQII